MVKHLQKMMIIAVLSLVSTASFADSWQEMCKSSASLAQAIMTGRQSGVAMSDMMDTLNGANKSVSDLTSAMIIDAYDSPRYNTEEIKQSTISDFRDKWYLSCVKNLKK